MINGCVTKHKLKTKSPTRVMLSSTQLQTKTVWGKVSPLTAKRANTKKKDCIDCYATPMDYSKPPSAIKTFAKVKNTKHYGAYAYTETASDTSLKTINYASSNKYIAPVVSTVNSSYGKYSTYSTSTDTAIQVGAFRKYAGAKIYRRRYNALSNNYKVSIKRGTETNQPLYKVRIEGFKNKVEAEKFMYSYGIRDAFVVRR